MVIIQKYPEPNEETFNIENAWAYGIINVDYNVYNMDYNMYNMD